MVLDITRIPSVELQTELIRRGDILPVKIQEPLRVVTVFAEAIEEPSEGFEFSLDTARDYQLLSEIPPGDFILAATDGTLTGISIRLGLTRGSGSNERLTWHLDQSNQIRRHFNFVFLKNNVQAGKTLRLSLGREALAEAVSQVISAEFKNKISAIVASTTALLVANDVYSSKAFSLEDSAKIVGSVYSDQGGTLYVEQRQAATGFTDWDVQSRVDYTAGEKIGFSIEVVATEGRVRFWNGGVDQGAFRLATCLRRV